ncbi:MAG TPA: hypothetical protein VIG37_07690 [Methylomirabilota bacterium]
MPLAPPFVCGPRPRPRITYVDPAHPGYAPGGYAPRYYGHW